METMSITEAAQYLGITTNSVYQAIRNRRLTGRKEGRVWALDADSVKLYKREVSEFRRRR